jgi:hypothetical protein
MQEVSAPLARERRRAGPRVALTSRVELECEGLATPLAGASLDVGLGGLCIELPCTVDLASVRSVRVRHGRRDLSLAARGSWLRGPSADGVVLLGVQFLDLDSGQSSSLWQLLNHRALELTRFLVEQSDLAPIDVDVAMDLTLGTRRRQFAANQRIYERGSQSESSIFIVAHGRVSLEAETASGVRILLDHADAGQVFGGAPSLLGIPHVDSALALSAVQLLEIDQFSFRNLVAEKPFVARALEHAALRRYLLHIPALLRTSAAASQRPA